MTFLWFWTLLLVACDREDPPEKIPEPEDGFENPVMSSAPDPWVEQKDDWYYFTHTTGNNLKLYRTKAMEALRNAEVRTVWTPPASGMNAENIWAPEFHFIHGKWYCYYAADDGDNFNHRIWVLENASADPFQGEWVDKGALALPDDKWAIDGTYFEHNGQAFFLWSGWPGDENVTQVIYITKMSDALTPVGGRILLSQPELSWELHGGTPTVNEAPQFLAGDGKVFIVYSASGCWTDDYALGLLTADATADLTDPASWTKSAEPVFLKNPSAGAFGPGHSSFFKSPDGKEDWIIYHANENAGDGCGDERSTRMQRFGWTPDKIPAFGTPVATGAVIDGPSEGN